MLLKFLNSALLALYPLFSSFVLTRLERRRAFSLAETVGPVAGLFFLLGVLLVFDILVFRGSSLKAKTLAHTVLAALAGILVLFPFSPVSGSFVFHSSYFLFSGLLLGYFLAQAICGGIGIIASRRASKSQH